MIELILWEHVERIIQKRIELNNELMKAMNLKANEYGFIGAKYATEELSFLLGMLDIHKFKETNQEENQI